MPRSRGRGSITSYSLGAYATILIGVVTGPVIARLLGPAGRGLISGALAYYGLSSVVASLGIPIGVGYGLAQAREAGLWLRRFVYRSFLVAVLPGAVLGAVCYETVFGEFTWSVRLVAAVLVGSSSVALYSRSHQYALVAMGDLGGLAMLRLIPAVIPALGVWALAVRGIASTAWVLALYVAGIWAAGVFAGRASRAGMAGKKELEKGAGKGIIRFGLAGNLGSSIEIVNRRLDQALVLPVLGAAALGYYAVAVAIAELPTLGVAEALAARAFSEVGQAAGETLGREMGGRRIRQTVIVAVTLGGVVVAAGPSLVSVVYGTRFRAAVPEILILAPGGAALAIGMVSARVVTALGRPGIASWAEGIAGVVTVVGLLLSLRAGGIVAAAMVSTGAYSLQVAVLLIALSRLGVRGLMPRGRDLRDLKCVVVRRITRLRNGGRVLS